MLSSSKGIFPLGIVAASCFAPLNVENAANDTMFAT
jgi:hypothetical protein